MDIDDAWDSTCRVLLNCEIGELDAFENYLLKHIEIPVKRTSLEGDAVFVSSPDFSIDAKYISYKNLDYNEKFYPISINEIKDIDSVLNALTERFVYCGNIILGNSESVDDSTACNDVSYIYKSFEIHESKFIGFCHALRYCDHIFGSTASPECKYSINTYFSDQSVRCFETIGSITSSDCYYSANSESCTECMFSFNQKSQRYMIGNNKLSKDKYLKLKSKLIDDIAQNLISKKKIPTIIDIIGSSDGTVFEPKKRKLEIKIIDNKKEAFSKIEDSFAATCRILFGSEIGKLQEFEDWLFTHVRQFSKVKSAISDKTVYVAGWYFLEFLPNNLIAQDETSIAGKKKIPTEKVDELNLSNAPKLLEDIKFTTPGTDFGKNIGIVEAASYGNATHCFAGSCYVKAKYCGYCQWPRESKSCFGSSFLFSSDSCINCYHSVRLSRCFELDSCSDCADSYFCHNSEGLSECMFCFNVKSLRYAIGNVQYPKEQYLKFKKKILDEIASKLQKDKKLDLNIFNIGAKK